MTGLVFDGIPEVKRTYKPKPKISVPTTIVEQTFDDAVTPITKIAASMFEFTETSTTEP